MYVDIEDGEDSHTPRDGDILEILSQESRKSLAGSEEFGDLEDEIFCDLDNIPLTFDCSSDLWRKLRQDITPTETRSRVGEDRSRVEWDQTTVGRERSRAGGDRSRIEGERSYVERGRSRVGEDRSRVEGERSRVGKDRSRVGEDFRKIGGERSRIGGERSKVGGGRSREGLNGPEIAGLGGDTGEYRSLKRDSNGLSKVLKDAELLEISFLEQHEVTYIGCLSSLIRESSRDLT